MFIGQGPEAMIEHVTAWQCIGCGRIEAPQTCVGVCQDRKVEFVHASDLDELLAQLERSHLKAETLSALLRQLAWTTPHKGEWEAAYRALQIRARRALEALPNDQKTKPA
jgi:hypothetical protein